MNGYRLWAIISLGIGYLTCHDPIHAPAFGVECAELRSSGSGGSISISISFGDEGMLPVADC